MFRHVTSFATLLGFVGFGLGVVGAPLLVLIAPGLVPGRHPSLGVDGVRRGRRCCHSATAARVMSFGIGATEDPKSLCFPLSSL